MTRDRATPPPIQFWVQRKSGYGFPPNFRSPHGGQIRPIVKGGRWSVRRTVDRRWKAWTKGQAHRYNKRFDTHAEAIEWAVAVAWVFQQWPKRSQAGYRHEILIDIRKRGLVEVARELPHTLY